MINTKIEDDVTLVCRAHPQLSICLSHAMTRGGFTKIQAKRLLILVGIREITWEKFLGWRGPGKGDFPTAPDFVKYAKEVLAQDVMRPVREAEKPEAQGTRGRSFLAALSRLPQLVLRSASRT